MNIAVRYYTETHNTERLCDAAAEVLGVEALPIAEPLPGPVDKLILGTSPYKFAIAPEVKEFLKENANKVGTIYVVSCPALWTSSLKSVKDFCAPLGLVVSDNDFHCKGQFKSFHKGKPDEEDLAACRKWAEQILR